MRLLFLFASSRSVPKAAELVEATEKFARQARRPCLLTEPGRSLTSPMILHSFVEK